MKKHYSFLLTVFSFFAVSAQIVDIPDPAFKAALLSLDNVIDTNGDGEIQVGEAEAVTSISLNHCSLDNTIGIQAFSNLENLSFSAYTSIANPVDISGMASLKSLSFHKCSMPSIDLSNLTGLEDFSQSYVNIGFSGLESSAALKKIYFYNSDIDSFDLSPFQNLEIFSADDTSISTIAISGLANLQKFKLDGASLADFSGLDFSGMVNLKEFYISGGNLGALDLTNSPLLEEVSVYITVTALDVSTCANLRNLYCHGDELTSLNLSNNIKLERLSVSGNKLTAIDLTNLDKLQSAILDDNLFAALDFSGQTGLTPNAPVFSFKGNPNLAVVNLKNGRHEYADVFDLNCPSLVYVCVDDADADAFQNQLQNNNVTGIQVNTYCSFVPGGNYNTITGAVTFDSDNNGCGTSDIVFPNLKMNISATDGSGTTFSDSDGTYRFFTQVGEFVVTPDLENPYFTISPSSVTVNFDDNNNNTNVQNFCIAPSGMHHDVEVTLLCIGAARPGFDAIYRICYKNKGNQLESGSIELTFDDSVLDFVSAMPNTDSQSANLLHWNYSGLLPMETRSITFTVNVNSPVETPPVNNGDILNFGASITSTGQDETPQDNNFALADVVLGSFDPNDKTCLEGSSIQPEMVGDYLHYLIRFQNSGTFYAENVVVKDVIDTEKFDVSTLELTASSHPQTTRIIGNKVEFIFEAINLPAEQDNEPESHGFVAFKIKTKPTLSMHDVIENTADIFFDFNFPITTNTTSTSISQLGLGGFENASVGMAPNPVRNALSVAAKDKIKSVQVFDINGRLLQTSIENQMNATIDFSGKTTGIYFVKVRTEKGVTVQKIIKE